MLWKPATTNVDDASFITEVVKIVQSHENIDLSCYFATGMSNGGLMDYRLACSTDVFAAIVRFREPSRVPVPIRKKYR